MSWWAGFPAHAGILPPKRHLITVVDTFELPTPKGRGHKLQNAKKPKASKPTKKVVPQARKPRPRVEPTPAELEAREQKRREYELKRAQRPERKEHRRRQAQAKRQEAKSLGLCIGCGASSIPGQSRCETCAEQHRQYRRQAKDRAKQQREQASGQSRIF